MNRLYLLLFAVFFLAQSLLAAQRPPNIIFILADDLGWRDLACCGHPYHETPHLDQLVRQGMRFTQAYAPAPICSASRAAILTGKTPARLHFEFVTKDKPGSQNLHQPLQSPPFPTNLPLEETTIAEALSPAGYHTGLFGKWHVSQHHGGYLGWSPTFGPLQQGFAEGNSNFGSHPYGYRKGEGRSFGDYAPGQFAPDALTDLAISFVRNNKDRPFLLYWSHYFVHDPIHTRCRWLFDKYRQKLPPNAPDVRAAYGAMVETLDHQVGRLLQELHQLQLDDNTLIVFTSDNGANPNYAANGPFRGSKWNLYEAGIRVPMFVRWPGVVAANSTCDTPVILYDWLPTFREICHLPPGPQPIDGRSFLPLLTGGQIPWQSRPLIWHFPYYHPEKGFDKAPPIIGIDDFITSQTRPHSAIRLGDYKLLHFYEDNRDELYNLTTDIGEQHNLAASDPTRVRQLRANLDASLQTMNARMPTR